MLDFHHDKVILLAFSITTLAREFVLLPMVYGANSRSAVHGCHDFSREVTQNLNIFMSASRLVARSRLLILSLISFISLSRVWASSFPIDIPGLLTEIGVFSKSSFSIF